MENLYAPWRSKYSQSVKEEKLLPNECPFCDKISKPTTEDSKNFIVKRADHNFIILNKFPYNPGHVMILPNRHIKELTEMTEAERNEMMILMVQVEQGLKKAFNAQGINIGMNLGKAAGAGIPSHLHMHLVPRWEGDTNFLPVIGEVKQISFEMDDIFQKLKSAL